MDTDCILGVKDVNVQLDLKFHPSVLGALKSEIEPHLRIKNFHGCAPKVYAIDFAHQHSIGSRAFSQTPSESSLAGCVPMPRLQSHGMPRVLPGIQVGHREFQICQSKRI